MKLKLTSEIEIIDENIIGIPTMKITEGFPSKAMAADNFLLLPPLYVLEGFLAYRVKAIFLINQFAICRVLMKKR